MPATAAGTRTESASEPHEQPRLHFAHRKKYENIFFLKMTFKSFLVHLQTTDWQSLCSGGRHTPRLQDVLSSVMVGKLEGEDVSFPKIILRPHFKKEKPKAFWRGGDEGGRVEKNAARRRRRRWERGRRGGVPASW